MDQFQSLSDYVGMIRRHVVLITVTVLGGILLSVLYATSLPRLYETSALIQIEQPQIQDPTAGAQSVNASTLQQLQIVEQQVMARDNLLHIVEKFNLFAGGDIQNGMKAELLRQSATVTRVIDPTLQWRSDISPTALSITVTMQDPQVVALVANELVTNVLDQTRRRREERARETLEFFKGEEARVGGAIRALEQEIANFKSVNAEALPAGVDEAHERLGELRAAELDIERQIVELNTGLQPGASTVQANRVLRLEEQRALLRQRATETEGIIARAPEVERTFNTLERQLEKLSEQYRAITRSQAEAETGQMLQKSQQAESFTLLERALVPEYPISPNRKRIVASGTLVSLLVALAAAFLLELRNPVIRTARQLEQQVGIRPIVSIPTVEKPNAKARRHLIRSVMLGGVALVVILILGIVVAG